MTDRPALALPPEMAQQIAMQQKVERAGRQLLESLACQIYVQLAAGAIVNTSPGEERDDQLRWCAEQALPAAFPMAAQLGWHFQAAPPADRDGPAPERPT